ncbi:gluconokinase [Microbulbifer agarilyticus]|uniref:gluconokinase n=1 Tax=Microbulbifer agarilyticus TaxID=260552 RepID=UPI001CD36D97|nr:gluconokinase, GntK/IdnK-type [Microbulbifer agarilyticus]MCA0899548.1 AAA family ATPase [Microbulbifer agarilyticus]
MLICCGVSGSGKTTLARALAEVYAFDFVEADDFHSTENRAHMAAGQPLDEHMRAPWIESICTHLSDVRAAGRGVVMSNSCLRRAHRDRYRTIGFQTRFLYLHGEHAVIQARMDNRSGHFMPSTLLSSQFLDLENPSGEADVISLNVQQKLPEILACARNLLDDDISSWLSARSSTCY